MEVVGTGGGRLVTAERGKRSYGIAASVQKRVGGGGSVVPAFHGIGISEAVTGLEVPEPHVLVLAQIILCRFVLCAHRGERVADLLNGIRVCEIFSLAEFAPGDDRFEIREGTCPVALDGYRSDPDLPLVVPLREEQFVQRIRDRGNHLAVRVQQRDGIEQRVPGQGFGAPDENVYAVSRAGLEGDGESFCAGTDFKESAERVAGSDGGGRVLARESVVCGVDLRDEGELRLGAERTGELGVIETGGVREERIACRFGRRSRIGIGPVHGIAVLNDGLRGEERRSREIGGRGGVPGDGRRIPGRVHFRDVDGIVRRDGNRLFLYEQSLCGGVGYLACERDAGPGGEFAEVHFYALQGIRNGQAERIAGRERIHVCGVHPLNIGCSGA